jgi:hypothetical protein
MYVFTYLIIDCVLFKNVSNRPCQCRLPDYWVADPSETNSRPEEISIQCETLEKTEVENKNGEYNDIDNNGHQTQN